MEGNKSSDFKKGDKVIYIPNHVGGNKLHKDCEKGIVSSVNDFNVFVKYNNDEPYTAQSTSPDNLMKR